MSWFDQSKVGLFVHWGNFIRDEKFEFSSVDAFEQALIDVSWCAEHFVKAAKALHADYFSLAFFHSCAGYLKPYPSSVPGSPSTKRDILGEIITAFEGTGIKVVVYITPDPEHHLRGEGLFKLDAEEYAGYKGDHSIDITKIYDFSKHYAKDICLEIMDRYPQVAGFWFDGWHNQEVSEEVFGLIHQKNPNIVNIRNDFNFKPYRDEDIMSLEDMAKICEPSYDYVSATWINPGIKAECAITPIGHWDYTPAVDSTDYAFDPLHVVKEATTIIANGWSVGFGFGPRKNGTLPIAITQFSDLWNRVYSHAKPAFENTLPGGYISGGFNRGYLNNGGYCTTTVSADGNTHYLCLLEAPHTGHIIKLCDCGYRVQNVTDHKTGTSLFFEQQDGELIIEADNYNVLQQDGVQLFKIATNGQNVLGKTRITCPVMDRNYDYIVEIPENVLRISLNGNTTIQGLNLIQPEDRTVPIGGFAAPESRRVKDYALYGTLDGQAVLLKRGSLFNQKGGQTILFDAGKYTELHFHALSFYNEERTMDFRTTDDAKWIPAVFDGIVKTPTAKPMAVPFPAKQIMASSDNATWAIGPDDTLWGINGFGKNIYPSARDVKRVFVDTKDRLWIEKLEFSGNLRLCGLDIFVK